jgi:hypothetical protein
MTAHKVKQMWAWPIAVALASAVGLISALLGDGWADAAAWAGLGLPVFVAIFCVLRARSPDR